MNVQANQINVDIENIYSRLARLDAQVELLKMRNSRVERDKAWETSLTRKGLIVVSTYFVMVSIFSIIEYTSNKNISYHPFVNAIIPTTGFYLSTLAFGCIKNCWENKVRGETHGYAFLENSPLIPKERLENESV